MYTLNIAWNSTKELNKVLANGKWAWLAELTEWGEIFFTEYLSILLINLCECITIELSQLLPHYRCIITITPNSGLTYTHRQGVWQNDLLWAAVVQVSCGGTISFVSFWNPGQRRRDFLV